VAVVANHFPNLAPNSLQDVHEAVLVWHTDHDAKRIPPQSRLELSLDRAMMVVEAVSHGIMERCTGDPEPSPAGENVNAA
jgi:hypothetical protein